MANNPIDEVDGLATTAPVSKGEFRAWAKLRVRQAVESVSEIRATNFTGQFGGLSLEGANYEIDTDDTTTPDDGSACIRDLAGNAFKLGGIPDVVAVLMLVFQTRAQLYAELDYPANVKAEVIADPTASFNGVYRKNGDSGTGSWTRLGGLDSDLPGRLQTIGTVIYDWNDATENGFYRTNASLSPAPTNQPEGSSASFMGFVQVWTSDWLTQEVHRINGDGEADTMTWRRERNNSAWGDWYRLRASELEIRAFINTASDSVAYAQDIQNASGLILPAGVFPAMREAISRLIDIGCYETGATGLDALWLTAAPYELGAGGEALALLNWINPSKFRLIKMGTCHFRPGMGFQSNLFDGWLKGPDRSELTKYTRVSACMGVIINSATHEDADYVDCGFTGDGRAYIKALSYEDDGIETQANYTAPEQTAVGEFDQAKGLTAWSRFGTERSWQVIATRAEGGVVFETETQGADAVDTSGHFGLCRGGSSYTWNIIGGGFIGNLQFTEAVRDALHAALIGDGDSI